jgi:tRNA(Arg) A34 adenosine deaminase TadA
MSAISYNLSSATNVLLITPNTLSLRHHSLIKKELLHPGVLAFSIDFEKFRKDFLFSISIYSKSPPYFSISKKMSSTHSPTTLISTLLSVTESRIVPLTRTRVSSGSKLFGAAVLSKSSLEPITVESNNERVSPLLHGEINCIQTFFATNPSPEQGGPRPATKDCLFFATHEPCSLCLSGITWSGFNEFYYLFTYEDSRDLFGIPCTFATPHAHYSPVCISVTVPAALSFSFLLEDVDDIDILQSVFQVPSPSDTPATLATKPLYNRTNKFFTARSVTDLVAALPDEAERTKWTAEVERVKAMYNQLSDTYQKGKAEGVETTSVFL